MNSAASNSNKIGALFGVSAVGAHWEIQESVEMEHG